jgi:hypothetical protein
LIREGYFADVIVLIEQISIGQRTNSLMFAVGMKL